MFGEDDDGDIGDLDTGSIQLHEMFASLCRAGFTREEAMELIKIPFQIMAKAGIEGKISDE
tara:strand:+ start:14131 stop:14313 length:183 start_codon:yes stop_codon:yes gene_type:complete